MFVETLKTMRLYERLSKCGVYHTFHRKNTIFVFKCDSCGTTFLRPRAKVDPDRATNDYKHVCSYCDSKRFAQKVGVKMRKVYKLDASSTKTLQFSPLYIIPISSYPSLQISINSTFDIWLIKIPTQKWITFEIFTSINKVKICI